MRKAIPYREPVLAEFATAQDALAHRAQRGGWVFIRDDSSRSTWFDATMFTPTSIMRHPACDGSGRLV